MTQETIKTYLDEFYSEPPEKVISQTKQTFVMLIKFGV